MQAYPFLWLPVAILIGTPILLISPYLVVIVLMLLVVALVAALAGAPYLLGRHLVRRWRAHARPVVVAAPTRCHGSTAGTSASGRRPTSLTD